MKYLLFLIPLMSCSMDEVVIPPTIVDCPHTIERKEGGIEDRLTICITSDLPEVYITVGDYPRRKTVMHYYKCISYHVSKDEVAIKIEAEQICKYIY